jgi:hypothetical protein
LRAGSEHVFELKPFEVLTLEADVITLLTPGASPP